MAPVNDNEAELAAQCILARAQAEDVMRLIRVHTDDIKLVIEQNAQYLSMVKLALAANNRLVREQQQRRKRETNHKDADQDEWTRHIAAQAMLEALLEEPKPIRNPYRWKPRRQRASPQTRLPLRIPWPWTRPPLPRQARHRPPNRPRS